MPIEIRELVIKTEIISSVRRPVNDSKDKQLEKLKKFLLQECKRMIDRSGKGNMYKR